MRSVPLVSLLLFAGLLAACAGSSNRSPSSPLPSGTPIDLALADRMYAEGDTDSASVIYSNAVTSGSLAQKQEAALKLARIAYSGGDEHGAAGNARALLESSPPAETQRRAYLLLGYSELAQGHDAPAKAAFEKYVQSGGPALPYAQLKLADIASRNKDSLTAERLAAAALTAGLPPQSETDALFALARYQKSNGETDGAAATYKRLVEHGATSTDRGEALWQGAQLAAAGGDVSTYVTSLRSLVAVYPSHERALQALQDPGIGTPAERAYVQFRNRLNDEATASYQALIADGDAKVQGDAHYHLGILAERAGDPDGALNEYTAAITALNGSGDPLLGDAYWDSATVLEAAGRPDEAVEHYSAVFEAAPGSDHAAEGLFRAGLIRYRQAGPGDAAGLWSRYLSAATAVEDKARGHFWLARAEGAAGQAGLEAAELRAAETAAPLSYYGLRARARAAAATPAADPPTLPDANPDPARTEAWLAAAFGAEPTPTAASRLQSDGWRRGVELLGAGLAAEADEQFDQVIDSSPAPWDLYRMARAMKSAGRVRPAARAAQALAGRQSDPPPELLSLAYPAHFAAAVEAAASQAGVSPFLLLALVRQESFFDASAASPAGALGLTQVIPATGRQIAAELGDSDFRDTALLKPGVSLRYGAHYLKSQLDAFGGSVAAALAAYNGGPGNAGRWQEAAGDDDDLLLETIDYPETRTYVQVVLENYALYRYAYGITNRPALP